MRSCRLKTNVVCHLTWVYFEHKRCLKIYFLLQLESNPREGMVGAHRKPPIRLQGIRHWFGDAVQQDVAAACARRAPRSHTGLRKIDQAFSRVDS